jgi:hypothetical protein
MTHYVKHRQIWPNIARNMFLHSQIRLSIIIYGQVLSDLTKFGKISKIGKICITHCG